MVIATCSTATGTASLAAAAGDLTRVSLELGGQFPLIVLPDADSSRSRSRSGASGVLEQWAEIELPIARSQKWTW